MRHGSYLVRTSSGSMYWIELGDESWMTRVPDDANVLGLTMRRDGERIRVLHIAQLEVGTPMGLMLENLFGTEGAVSSP